MRLKEEKKKYHDPNSKITNSSLTEAGIESIALAYRDRIEENQYNV